MRKTKADKPQQQKNVDAGLGVSAADCKGGQCGCGGDSSSRCHCVAALGGQLAVPLTDLRRFWNTPLGKLFDLTLLEHLLLKKSIAAVYLFFFHHDFEFTETREINFTLT